MLLTHILIVLPMAFALLGADHDGDRTVVRRVIVRDEIILRIPVRSRPVAPVEWREERGPKCVATANIAGAMLTGRNSVDFVLRDRGRLRAELDKDCLALDFYDGFYLQPSDDRLCVRRDVIRSRIGGACRIERFRELVPRFKR